MHPYLFDLPLPFREEPFHLRSFGLMVAIGFLVGAHVLQRLVARYSDDPKEDPARFSQVTLWILIGVFAGARLMYVVVEILRGSPTGQGYLDAPLTALFIWEGGLVMYGGLAGGIIGGVWCGVRLKMRIAAGLDLGLIAGFVGLSIGRIGCLLVGDDYGARVPEEYASLPFPITLRVPEVLPEGSLFGQENAGQVLWATQPWMSVNSLLLAIIGYQILKRRHYGGQVSLWLVLLYSIGRFVIENFRGDEVRGMWFGDALSTSQVVAIVTGLASAGLLFAFRNRRESLPQPTPAERRTG